ncbi:unnamed protein product [Timema podura]|uniref:Uncharacterized protein n=1 Tax=Timema podura TaxID=61482 RepID=A0ABN7PUS1_TIMPD|nr:unnamed protein product [Timema podura]
MLCVGPGSAGRSDSCLTMSQQ